MTTEEQPWPTEPKLPTLVDGQLSIEQLKAAIAVLHHDGEETPMTLSEVIEWLELHVERRGPPPDPESRLRRRSTSRADVGRPGRMTRTGASAAA